MLGQQVHRERFFVNRRVHDGVPLQGKPVVLAAQDHRLGRSGTQVKREQLVAFPATGSIQKGQSHDCSWAAGGLRRCPGASDTRLGQRFGSPLPRSAAFCSST